MRCFLLFFIGLLSLSSVAQAQMKPCNSGLDAFKRNLHPVLSEKCVRCHAQGGPGPQYLFQESTGSADVARSYDKVKKSYVNFIDVAGSLLVTKGGNGHCKQYGVDCDATATELNEAVQKWWEGGENACVLEGALVTKASPLPSDLASVKDRRYSVLEWNLGEIHPRLSGIMFRLQVQKFSEKSPTTSEAYRFFKPVIYTTTTSTAERRSIQVRGIKVLINGKYDPASTAFAHLNVQTADSEIPFALSTRTMIVLADQGANTDQITIAFDDVSFNTPIECKDVAGFVALMSQFRGTCQSCHNGSAFQVTRKFDLSATPEKVCAQFLVRVNKSVVSQSPLFLFGLGHGGHPMVFRNEDEASGLLRQLKLWLKKETPFNAY